MTFSRPVITLSDFAVGPLTSVSIASVARLGFLKGGHTSGDAAKIKHLLSSQLCCERRSSLHNH